MNLKSMIVAVLLAMLLMVAGAAGAWWFLSHSSVSPDAAIPVPAA